MDKTMEQDNEMWHPQYYPKAETEESVLQNEMDKTGVILFTSARQTAIAAMKEWETLTNKSRDEEIEEYSRNLKNAVDYSGKLTNEIYQQAKEIERLKGLIKKQWEINFYLTCPSSVHAGVMDELFKNQLQKFKTENNL